MFPSEFTSGNDAVLILERITTDSLDMMVDRDEAGAEWQSETIITSNETTPTFNKLNKR